MKKIASLALSLFLLTGTAYADSPKEADPKPAKAAKAKAPSTSDSAIAAQLEELRQAIQSQQEQLQLLKEELAKRDRQIEEARETAAAANARAAEATVKAAGAATSVAEVKSSTATLNTTVTSLAASNAAILKSGTGSADQAKPASSEDGPATINYKGVRLTPGGFIDAEYVFRSRNENASINSATAGNIPLGGSANSHLTESRFDARQSRIALGVATDIGSTKLNAYYEADFLGAAPTSNENESNSFVLRQRQLYAKAEFADGIGVAGGQMWSLMTLNRTGIAPNTFWTPMTIDAQYNVGFTWDRQPGFRFYKKFGDGIWAGVAVENASTILNAANPPSGLLGFNTSANATSPSGLLVLNNVPGANGVSTNAAPDFIAKLVIEPGWGHFEIKGVGRFFRDRVPDGATYGTPGNHTTGGGGIGFGAIMPIVKNPIHDATSDFVINVLAGNGIGRYGNGQGVDVTVRPNGTIVPVRSYQILAGPEMHFGKKFDVNLYGGYEYYGKAAYSTVPTTTNVNPFGGAGYGSGFINIANCSALESTSCSAQTRYVYQIQPVFIYRFYKGNKGTFQWMGSYSYSFRKTYTALNVTGTGTVASPFVGTQSTPSGLDHMIITGFRYILP